MPTWLKVVLVVVGILFVLLVAAGVGLFYVAQKYGPGLLEAGKHAMEEGRDYGRGTDGQGCVTEAVTRHRRADGLGAMISNNLFLRGCLDASRPTPHFCDDVPRQTDFMKGARWQMDECKRYGLSPESQCGQLFQQVQQFCDARRLSGAKDDAGANQEDGEKDSDDDAPPAPPPPPPAPRP